LRSTFFLQKPSLQRVVVHMEAALQGEHTKLKTALHAVARELRKVRARAAARSARPRAAAPCSAAQWCTLCSLCAAGNGDTTSAAAYLRHVRGEKMEDATCNMLVEKVRLWWEQSSAAERHAWAAAPRTCAQTRAVSAAQSFLHASRLHACVTEQNFLKGIAPTSRGVLHLLQGQVVSHSASSTRLPGRRSQFQWLRRWRRRWRVKLGRIAAREQIPEDVARAKAAARHKKMCAAARLFLPVAGANNALAPKPKEQNEGHQAALI